MVPKAGPRVLRRAHLVEERRQVCWTLANKPEDWDIHHPTVDFLKQGFLHLLEEGQVVKMLEMFALNHKKANLEDVQLSTTFRYCCELWLLYHRHNHQLKIDKGDVDEFSIPVIPSLNDAAPHIRQIMFSVGKERLQQGNLTDNKKHSQENMSDVHVVRIVRYLYGQGTVATRQKMVHFLFALNFHRRSGNENCKISKYCLTFGPCRNHTVCIVCCLFIYYIKYCTEYYIEIS